MNEDHAHIHGEWHRAASMRDLPALLALYADDATLESPLVPAVLNDKSDGVLRGKAEIAHFLETGEKLPPPEVAEIRGVMVEHLHDLYAFYGRERGVRVARKHIGWYTKGLRNSAVFRARMNTLETAVDRNDFGIAWNAPNQSGGNYLGDEVTLKADLTFVRQES